MISKCAHSGGILFGGSFRAECREGSAADVAWLQRTLLMLRAQARVNADIVALERYRSTGPRNDGIARGGNVVDGREDGGVEEQAHDFRESDLF